MGADLNKAFVKEPEEHGDQCPNCGSRGEVVFPATLKAHLKEEDASKFSDSGFFCPLGSCDVAYFDRSERCVTVDRLNGPVYPKNPDAPICPCFGLTCDDIEQDIEEGVVTRVRAHREKALSEDTRCTTRAADGQCCIPAVQRYYMRRRSGS
jgi:hypothetical protein